MREFLRELAAVAVAALVYYLVRGAVSDRADEAFQRARDIFDLEQRLWLDWEIPIHEAILGTDALIDFANGTYFWGHMPLLIVLAVWLWRSHRSVWRTFRNALLLSAAAGMVSYYLFPTAPPRLMPDLGFVDTLALSAQRPPTRPRRSACLSTPTRRIALAARWLGAAGRTGGLADFATSAHAGIRGRHSALTELGGRRHSQPLDPRCLRRNGGLRGRVDARRPAQ